MSTRTLAPAWALNGLVIKLMWAGLMWAGLAWPGTAWAQSALAQQAADQEKAAQQGTATSSTDAGTAKPAPAKAKPTAAKPDATTAPATKPTTAPAASTATTKSATPKSAAAKPAAAKPDAATTAAKPVAVKKAPAKPVVYVDDGVKSGGTSTAPGASASGKPQNREVVKVLEQSCPDVTLTDQRAKAGYDVALEREPGSKGVKTVFGLTNVVHKTNKIEVTSKSGKEVFSEVGHSTDQLVKDACAAIAAPPTRVAKN